MHNAQPDERLQALFAEHLPVPIPRGPAGDELLADLRADLIDYDSYVAGYATRALRGEALDPAVLAPAGRFAARIAELLAASPERREALEPFAAYTARLDRLLAAAVEAHAAPG